MTLIISRSAGDSDRTARLKHHMRPEETGQEGHPDPALTMRLFGGMALGDSRGASFLPRSRKTRAMVVILALAAPKPVFRLQLTALLWSQREKEQARASLRQAVHELQEILGAAWSRILRAERHHLSIDLKHVAVDALTAEADPSAGRTGLLRLFQDGFLEDLSGLDPAFDDWLSKERRRFLMIARQTGETLLRESQSREDTIGAARALLRVDPAHDRAWRALINGHIEGGDRAAALFACEQWREAMALPVEASPPVELNDFLARIHGRPVARRLSYGGTSVHEDIILPHYADADPALSATEMKSSPPDTTQRRASLRLGIAEPRVIGQGVDPGLAEGLAEEVTTALSRFRWISCISVSSLLVLSRGEVRREDLDLDLFLDGTIQGGANQVRITVRLLDMRAGGAVIWAARFDRDPSDVLSLQDEVAASIVAQVDPFLLIREGDRAVRDATGASPRDLVLRAVPAIYRLDRMSFDAAGEWLEAALRLDPLHTDALAWLAYWHLFLVGQGWADDPAAATARAGTLADTAVMTDPNDARALTLAGHVRGFLLKRAAEAAVLHDRAISLNPNLAIAWCFSGFAQSYLGRQEQALTRMRQAISLSPSDPHLFFFRSAIIMPHLLRGDYEEAAAAGREAVELNPWFSSPFKGFLATLGHQGQKREAASVLARLLVLEPRLTVSDAMRRSPMTRAEDVARYGEGLRLGGLPES